MQSGVPVGQYTHFLSTSLSALSQHLTAKILPNVVLNWYETQLRLVNEWLGKRRPFSLHSEQLSAITAIVEVQYHYCILDTMY